MKTIVALCAAALLAGCSSVPMQKAENDVWMNCDYERMGRLERIAKEQRAELHWVNCPQLAKNRVKTT